MAHLILFFHIGLIALLGLVVLLLGGIARHLTWFFIGGAVMVLAVAYVVFYRLKHKRNAAFKTIEALPHLRDGEIEIRILGGIISLKFNRLRKAPDELPLVQDQQRPQLEDPDTVRNRELLELADLVEKDLITREEFNRIKQKILIPE